MHPKSPFRSIVSPRTKLLDQKYALRLVVVPSQYFPSPSLFFQPIPTSLSSHISSIAIPHLLHRRIHTCCPKSTPPCLSYVVFTTDIVYHTHFPEQRYALRLAVVTCKYLPSPSPSLQPISTSLLYHISSVAVPNLLRCRIHPYCPASPPPCSSDAVFTADLVCHP